MQLKHLSPLLSLAVPLAVAAPTATFQGDLFDCACATIYDICIGENNGNAAAQLRCVVQFVLCTIPCNLPVPSGLALPTSLLSGLPIPTLALTGVPSGLPLPVPTGLTLPVPTGLPTSLPLTVPTGLLTVLPIPLPNPL